MEEEDEDPPLAVEINQLSDHHTSNPSLERPENVDASSVGVTVITGYLGSGKSTVCTTIHSHHFLWTFNLFHSVRIFTNTFFFFVWIVNLAAG